MLIFSPLLVIDARFIISNLDFTWGNHLSGKIRKGVSQYDLNN